MTQLTPKASIPYAELTDAPNMQTYAQGIATTLDGMVSPKYLTVSQRDSSNPSPTAGDSCYCADQDMFYVYSGSSASWVWQYPKTVYKASATARASTTSKTSDPDLTWNVETNSVYEFFVSTAWYNNSAAAGGGWQWTFTLPASAQASHSTLNIDTSSTGFNTVQMNVVGSILSVSPITGSGGDSDQVTSTTPLSQHTSGILVTAGTGGQFAFSWAQHNSSSNAMNLAAGSFMRLQKVR